MNTHWNAKLQHQVFILQPSSYYVTVADELISTVLGSCIAVCLRDDKNKIGGMNHFLLPSNSTNKKLHWPKNYDSESLRYGDISMELLINTLISKGARRENFEAKIFGGAAVVSAQNTIGDNNIRFVREYLKIEEIPVSVQDVGGNHARKIFYNVANGEVWRLLLPQTEQMKISLQEQEYLARINANPLESEAYFWDDV